MTTSFVHLQLHSEYSLLDSAVQIKRLMKRVASEGMPAVALTDRGNLYAALEFYYTAKSEGIKPIVGCEFYIAPTDRTLKKADRRFNAFRYVIALAKSYKGYENLMKMSSQAFEDGFYYVPRIDKKLLSAHKEDLVIISPMWGSSIGRFIAQDRLSDAEADVKWYQQQFADDFYMAIQSNAIPAKEGFMGDAELRQATIDLAQKHKVGLVATNDVFYLDQSEAHAHEILMAIKDKKTLQDERRPKLSSDTFYLRTADEMAALFKETPEALSNTLAITEKCNISFDYGEYHAPQFQIPQGFTPNTYLAKLSEDGLKERFTVMREVYGDAVLPPEKEMEYNDRLAFEINMINDMGFPGYFLIVNDFIAWAKGNGIPVGPGRGSAAGSLVAYALKITDIDPMPYGLLFERFLNPERISMPDIDVDFCQDKRGLVLDYVREKYGSHKVASITTFGRMKAKAVIRDVGRVLGLSFSEVDVIAKLVPNDLTITIPKALEQEPKFKELREQDPVIDKLLTISLQLEGLCRHVSTHACGVVISEKAMVHHVPTYRDKESTMVTQFEGKWVEKTGLIKFDFLGLKNLTAIKGAEDLIHLAGQPDFDIMKAPLNDDKVFALLSSGNTTGVFQLESSGMRGLLKKLRPSCFEDCIALVALYRPGPLGSGMVDQYVERKHGRQRITYLHPDLKPVLDNTYGVILYQEQVQKTAVILANYSLGEADILRRAMGKKKPEEMAKQRDRFISGATENGIPQQQSEAIFDLMAQFAAYGFNKSHSAAYGLIAYQTAYLKTYYPVEFIAACMTCDMDNTSKVTAYLHNCNEMNIAVLPPDINHSMRDFSVDDAEDGTRTIRFGLGGIKNVGSAAIDAIIEVRKTTGEFTSIFDFCEKVDLRRVNKRVIENLIKAGCFSALHGNRNATYAAIARAVDLAERIQKDRACGQESMFELFQEEQEEDTTTQLPEVDDWAMMERLTFELETMGRYITGHPLDEYKSVLKRFFQYNTLGLDEVQANEETTFAGIICELRRTTNKRGQHVAYFELEDLYGRLTIIVGGKVFPLVDDMLDTNDAIFVRGRFIVDRDEGTGELAGYKIFASEVGFLSERVQELTQSVRFVVHHDLVNEDDLKSLHTIMTANEAQNEIASEEQEGAAAGCSVDFKVIHDAGSHVTLKAADHFRIQPALQLLKKIDKNFEKRIEIEYCL